MTVKTAESTEVDLEPLSETVPLVQLRSMVTWGVVPLGEYALVTVKVALFRVLVMVQPPGLSRPMVSQALSSTG